MNRTEEIRAIDAHVAAHGVRQCTMGEMYYDDAGPSFRERVTFTMKNASARKKPRIHKTCETCGKSFTAIPSQSVQKYCNRKCAGIGAGAKRTTSVMVKCDQCGELHSRILARMNMKYKFCSPACSSKHKNGRKAEHPGGWKTELAGVVYPSLTAAARAAGVSRDTLKGMMNRRDTDPAFKALCDRMAGNAE